MALWLVLFWSSIAIAARHWRSSFKDPMCVTSIAVWLGTGTALFITRLDSWLNYWFGVLPFVYYIIAWACYEAPESRASGFMRKAAWAGSVLSFILILHFAVLVHQMRGLPGEYGPSYQSQRQ
jgi:hypothetical protein